MVAWKPHPHVSSTARANTRPGEGRLNHYSWPQSQLRRVLLNHYEHPKRRRKRCQGPSPQPLSLRLPCPLDSKWSLPTWPRALVRRVSRLKAQRRQRAPNPGRPHCPDRIFFFRRQGQQDQGRVGVSFKGRTSFRSNHWPCRCRCSWRELSKLDHPLYQYISSSLLSNIYYFQNFSLPHRST